MSRLDVRGDLDGTFSTASANFTVAPRFGFNYDIDGGLPAVASKLGCQPFTAAKIFNSSMPLTYPGHSIPASVTHPLAVIKITLTTASPWISDADRAGLAKVFASMPKTGSPMVSINQEGEAGRFNYSGAQVAGSHATAYAIFRATAPANAVYCQDLQTYSASPQGRGAAFPGYLCPGLPLYLLDWYPTNTTTGAVASITPAFTALRVLTDAPIGIAECNWLANNGAYHGPGTADQWLAGCWAWALANDCPIFMPYYLTAHGTPWPPDAASLSELSAIAHESGL
jgi:hypothetical protein